MKILMKKRLFFFSQVIVRATWQRSSNLRRNSIADQTHLLDSLDSFHSQVPLAELCYLIEEIYPVRNLDSL